MRISLVAGLLAAALMLTACSSGESGGINVGTPSGDGSLFIARIDGIVEMSLEDEATIVRVAPASASEFFLDVAVSPAGDRIAYTVQPPPRTVDGRYDAGSDLWIANRDGSDARMVFQHVQPSQLVRYPQWDGEDHLLAVIQEYREVEGLTQVDYTVQRIDIATGARERILDDALTYALSPDGRQIAYARLSPRIGEVFEVVDVPPGEPRTLVEPSQMLSPFNSPRYSPDGSRIAFASADQRLAPPTPGAPSPEGSTPPTGVRPMVARNAAPLPDGLPQDVWIVDASGGVPAHIAPLQEDFPALTWNGDGTHIYAIGAYGLYDIDMTNGNWTRIGDGAFHAGIAWAP